ncbi:hypothetical protein CRQ32_24290 [Salmonella enterica]|nr:hypothetical protein [Salmonella enterica]EKE2606423.1 hypothetical protein [Salmonella enterica]MIP16822.1 hypothetical protein [Salmonella enterica]HCB4365693.1 hypothetical protein [Salmonella enterica]
MYFIYGKCYPSSTVEQVLSQLTEPLHDTLSQPLPVDALFVCAERFVKRLEDTAFFPQIDAVVREEVSQFCQPDALRFKLEHELGEIPFSLRRFNLSQPHFESWRPLGVV